MHIDGKTITLALNRALARNTRFDHEFRPSLGYQGFSCLSRIAHEIKKNLDELFAIPHDRRNRDVIIAKHGKSGTEFNTYEIAHSFQHFVQIDFG